MAKIIIADTLHSSAKGLLQQEGHEVLDLSKNKDLLDHEIKDADAIIVRSATKVRGNLLDIAQDLKIVGRAGVGIDNIDVEGCKARNIKVVNSPEGPTRSVAELTLGLMIASSRHLNIVNSGTKDGKWPKKTKGIELYGKTLGIIGSGAIGGQLAKYCIALGMNILAYDIVKIKELEKLDGFSYVDIDQLILESDFISMHVPLVPPTKHMLNKETFSKMKDGVIIINCARGGVIDEDDLLEALETGKVSAAALDVYEVEPIDHKRKLIQHPRVLTTPHIGAQTFDASRNNTVIICQKIIDYFEN